MQSQLVLMDVMSNTTATVDLTPETIKDPKRALKTAIKDQKPKASPRPPKASQRQAETKGKHKAGQKPKGKPKSKPKGSPWQVVAEKALDGYSKGYSFKVSSDSHKKQASLTVATIPYQGWNWSYITSRVETESTKFRLAGCPASLYRSIQPVQSQINDIDECNFSLTVKDNATRDDLPLLSKGGFNTLCDVVRYVMKVKPKSYKLKVVIGEIGTCLYSKETEPKFVRKFRKEEDERLASYGYGAKF